MRIMYPREGVDRGGIRSIEVSVQWLGNSISSEQRDESDLYSKTVRNRCLC